MTWAYSVSIWGKPDLLTWRTIFSVYFNKSSDYFVKCSLLGLKKQIKTLSRCFQRCNFLSFMACISCRVAVLQAFSRYIVSVIHVNACENEAHISGSLRLQVCFLLCILFFKTGIPPPRVDSLNLIFYNPYGCRSLKPVIILKWSAFPTSTPTVVGLRPSSATFILAKKYCPPLTVSSAR